MCPVRCIIYVSGRSRSCLIEVHIKRLLAGGIVTRGVCRFWRESRRDGAHVLPNVLAGKTRRPLPYWSLPKPCPQAQLPTPAKLLLFSKLCS